MNKYAEIPPEIIERATELAMLELYENANICVEGFNQAQALLDLMDKHISLLYKPQHTAHDVLGLPTAYQGANEC